VVVVAVNIMEKFILGNSGIDSSIRSTNDANIARFVHLNAVVENLNTLISKYTTIIPARQLATLNSDPVELNVPEGMYSFIVGYIYYPLSATVTLEINNPFVYVSDQTFILCKSRLITINGDQILNFESYVSDVNRIKSGKVYLSSTDNVTEAPDSPAEITLYLTKLNLGIGLKQISGFKILT
jgi:hypothetical protein